MSFLDLYPFSFGEYLEGIGNPQLYHYLAQKLDFKALEASFHEELLDHLKMYFFIGGMPEAIVQYKQSRDLQQVRTVQQEILTAYSFDFSKYASPSEAMKLIHTWNAIPGQLAKENKKFKFSEISKNARAREYDEVIQWL